MITYITKEFCSTKKYMADPSVSSLIDNFLNSGLNKEPLSEYNKEIVGYVSTGDKIIITVKIFQYD